MKQPRQKISNYVADQTLRHGISKHLTRQLAAYLLSQNRTGELDSILRDVRQDWANQGVVEVLAVNAFTLSPKVITDIKAEIRKVYPHAKQIIVTPVLDPSVVAGVRLELANEQLDLSVKSKLNKFKQLSIAGETK